MTLAALKKRPRKRTEIELEGGVTVTALQPSALELGLLTEHGNEGDIRAAGEVIAGLLVTKSGKAFGDATEVLAALTSDDLAAISTGLREAFVAPKVDSGD